MEVGSSGKGKKRMKAVEHCRMFVDILKTVELAMISYLYAS